MQSYDEKKAAEEISRRLKKGLWLGLPLSVFLGVFIYTNLVDYYKNSSRFRLIEVQAKVASILTESVGSVRRDLDRLAVLAEGASSGALPDEALMTGELLTVSKANPEYYQVRWIDDAGMERIRVDQIGGKAVLIQRKNLQLKADRYYFKGSIQLPPGAFYISPLDLNIENGKIEVPYRPVVRIARRIHSGILIINVDFAMVLKRLRRVADAGKLQLFLLNAEGYYLLGESSDQEWGFQSGHPEARVMDTNPDLALQMSKEQTGELLSGSGLWLFSRMSPIRLENSMSPQWAIVLQDRTQGTSIRLQAVMVTFITLLLVSSIVVYYAYRFVESRVRQELILADLSETEERLAQSERLSSLGLMLAGMAHELNTPVGSALIAATAVKDRLEQGNDLDPSRLYRGMSIVVESLQRAANLIKTFKQLATDRATSERRTFLIKDVVEDVLAALHAQTKNSGHRIDVSVSDSISMNSYPGALGQILQNLVQNALKHAFPTAGGTIRITTEKKGADVYIKVSDNGKGIPADDLKRVFDPFFTTKRQDGGMGLGLHLCHQLAENPLGGQMQVSSQSEGLDRGTQFVVVLPVVAPIVEAKEAST